VWPLLTVETEAFGDLWSTNEGGSSLVGSLGFSCECKSFSSWLGCSGSKVKNTFSSPYTISIYVYSPPVKVAWTVHHNTNLTFSCVTLLKPARRAPEWGHLSSLRPHLSKPISPKCRHNWSLGTRLFHLLFFYYLRSMILECLSIHLYSYTSLCLLGEAGSKQCILSTLFFIIWYECRDTRERCRTNILQYYAYM
jgi:hypothetical protein